MTVVAILGILLALTIGVYRAALIRAHIAEGFALVGPMKTAIVENLMTDLSGDACDGVDDSVEPVGFVDLIQCVDDGAVARIRVEMEPEAGDAVFELVGDRTDAPSWRCVSDPDWPGYSYLPGTCRN